MKILENVRISDLVTMRIGGVARYVIEIFDKSELKEAYNFIKEQNLPYFFLGGGANTFAKDDGFDGAIIINKITGITELEDGVFEANGGENWDKFVTETAEKGYTGIEAMAKIPGTVGAAPVQNIGAYGQDASQTIVSAEVFDFKTGEQKTIEKSEMDLSYRHSIFNSGEEKGRYFIISVKFQLKKGEIEGELYNSLQRYMDEHNETDRSPKNIARMVAAIRADKLPDPETTASSGSFFKNVYVREEDIEKLDEKNIPHHGTKVNTGWLIENAGLKGKTFHGMKVSDKAALVLINESAISYEDLKQAREEISDAVYDKFGFRLEQEPVEIGEEHD